MYYNECSICGAALDPGERCDCEKEQAVHQEEVIEIAEKECCGIYICT